MRCDRVGKVRFLKARPLMLRDLDLTNVCFQCRVSVQLSIRRETPPSLPLCCLSFDSG